MTIYFTEDGWINVSATCKAFGKRAQHYLNSDAAKRLNDHLVKYKSEELKCPEKGRFFQFEPKFGKSDTRKSAIFVIPKFIEGWKQGTYLHPKLSVNLAEWLRGVFSIMRDVVRLNCILPRSVVPTTP